MSAVGDELVGASEGTLVAAVALGLPTDTANCSTGLTLNRRGCGCGVGVDVEKPAA